MKKWKTLLAASTLFASSLAFAGEFGDYCTTGLSKGVLKPTRCEINELYQGKTYCFGSEDARDSFLLDPDNTIAKAAEFYAKNKEPERDKITQAQADAIIADKNCNLSNKDLGYLNFDGRDLRHCNMQNVSFFGAYLRGANLSGTNMQSAYLNLARLENANLSKTNLSKATIFQAIFENTNFAEANLTNARLIGTLGKINMQGANVQNGRLGLDLGNQPMGQMKFDSVGGNFAGANFENADLNIAAFAFGDLRGANLRGANMFRADLTKADLTDADLTGANLENADVDGAIFKNAKGLAEIKGWAMVKGQCVDCKIIADTKPSNSSDALQANQNAASQTSICMRKAARN